MISSGIVGDETGDFRALTLTAPGMDRLRTLDDLVDWNASHGRRVNAFLVMLRRLAPELEFVRVLELQKRGAIHSHWIVRGASHLTARRVRRCAVAAGFGSRVDWAPVRTMAGLSWYLVGYMMKSRDVFPSGTRVLVKSQGWDVKGSSLGLSSVHGAERGGPDASESAQAPESARADASDAWYGGPPPGVTWTEWAEDQSMIAAGRAVLRRRRRDAEHEAFRLATRDRWVRWERSSNGRAAAARGSRGARVHPVGSRGS